MKSNKEELDEDAVTEITANQSYCPLTAVERTKLDFKKIYSNGQSGTRAKMYSLKCKWNTCDGINPAVPECPDSCSAFLQQEEIDLLLYVLHPFCRRCRSESDIFSPSDSRCHC